MSRELRPGDVRPEDFGRDGKLTADALRRLGLTAEPVVPSAPVARRDAATELRDLLAPESLSALATLQRNDPAGFAVEYQRSRERVRALGYPLPQWERARAEASRQLLRAERPTDATIAVFAGVPCPVALSFYLAASRSIDPWDRQILLEPLVPFFADHGQATRVLRALWLADHVVYLLWCMLSTRLSKGEVRALGQRPQITTMAAARSLDGWVHRNRHKLEEVDVYRQMDSLALDLPCLESEPRTIEHVADGAAVVLLRKMLHEFGGSGPALREGYAEESKRLLRDVLAVRGGEARCTQPKRGHRG